MTASSVVLTRNKPPGDQQHRAQQETFPTAEVGVRKTPVLHWSPKCDCIPKELAMRFISKKKGTTNFGHVYYSCRKSARMRKCKYFRWEKDLIAFVDR
ncbi:MAG: hypothetical protein ACREOZ_00785 [Gloeomargaritales cyanobacterium]